MKTDFELKVAIGWEASEVRVLRKGTPLLCRQLGYTGQQLADFLQKHLKFSRTQVLTFLGEQGYLSSVDPLPLQERFEKMVAVFPVLSAWFYQVAAQAEIVWNSLPFCGEGVGKYIQTPFSKWWPIDGWSVADGLTKQGEPSSETPLKYVGIWKDGTSLSATEGKLWNIVLSVKDGPTETVVLQGNKKSAEINFLLESFARNGVHVQFQPCALPERQIQVALSGPSATENIPWQDAKLFIVKQVATGLDFYVGCPGYKPSPAAVQPLNKRAMPCVAPHTTVKPQDSVPFLQTVAPRELEPGFYDVTDGFYPKEIPSFLPPSCMPGYLLKLTQNQQHFLPLGGNAKTGCRVVLPCGDMRAANVKKAVSSVIGTLGKGFTGYYAFNGKVIFSRNSFTADFPDLTLKGVKREAVSLQRALGVPAVLIKDFETGRIFVLEQQSAVRIYAKKEVKNEI